MNSVIPVRKAIAYRRFSTKKQEVGDSLRRQLDTAMKWCAMRCVELDVTTTFDDLGRSGFKGDNTRKGGALRTLVDMCKNGDIPKGTFILFEAFDRMTRMRITEAQELFVELLNTGVIVVTLNNGREWKRKHLNNINDYIYSILELFRGNLESARKSEILRDTFKEAREAGEKWKFASLPGWVAKRDGKKDGEFILIEELAESVRNVYEMAATGYSCAAISRRANSEKWPIPNRLNRTDGRWTPNTTRRLIMNPATRGEHEHKQYYREHVDEDGDVEIEYLRQGESAGITIRDYYPRVVNDEVWFAAQAAIIKKTQVPKRQSDKLNFWSGLLFCGRCGASMRRRQDLDRGGEVIKGSLQCSSALHHETDCKPMMFRKFDTVVLSEIGAHSYTQLSPIDLAQRQDATLESMQVALAEKRKRKMNLVDAIEVSGKDSDLMRRLANLNEDIRELETKIEEAKEAMVNGSGDSFDESFVRSVVPHLYRRDRESEDVRALLHLTLLRLIEYVAVWSYEVALVKLKNQQSHLVVPLPHKSHIAKPQPYLKLALAGELTVPELKRPKHYIPRFR